MGFYHNPVPNTLTDTLDQPVKELDLMRKFELERWAHFFRKEPSISAANLPSYSHHLLL